MPKSSAILPIVDVARSVVKSVHERLPGRTKKRTSNPDHIATGGAPVMPRNVGTTPSLAEVAATRSGSLKRQERQWTAFLNGAFDVSANQPPKGILNPDSNSTEAQIRALLIGAGMTEAGVDAVAKLMANAGSSLTDGLYFKRGQKFITVIDGLDVNAVVVEVTSKTGKSIDEASGTWPGPNDKPGIGNIQWSGPVKPA